MKPLLLSCVLILGVLSLSAPSLNAQGSVNDELVKSNPPSDIPAPSPGEAKSPDKPNRPKNKQKPEEDKRGTKEFPLFVQPTTSPAQDEAAEAKRIKEEKAAQQRHAENIATANHAVIASGIQAFILFVTIGVMIWTATRQLRAYISVTQADKALINVPGKFDERGIDIHLMVKNLGKTPAFQVRYGINADMLHHPLQSDPPRPEVKHGNTYIVPGGDIEIIGRWRAGWDLPMIDTNTGDDLRLYVWGEVHYKDAFKKKRFVKFRYFRERPGHGFELNSCHEGNDAN
jgi:hypothetical protein